MNLIALVPRRQAQLGEEHATVMEGGLRIVGQRLVARTTAHPANHTNNRSHETLKRFE